MADTITIFDTNRKTIDAIPATQRPAPLDWLLSFRSLDSARLQRDDFAPAAEWIRDGLDADNVYIVFAGPRTVGSNHAPQSDPNLNTASQAILAAALVDGQSVLLDRAGDNTPFAADPQLQRFNIVSVLCVPMSAAGRRLGVIYADARSPRPWNEGDLAILELAADLLALQWDHQRLFRQTLDNLAMAEAGLAAQKMSHAVKNILQMVCGAGEVIDFALKNKHLDRLQRSWDILQPNLQRMKKFTLDMLDYSRPRPFEFAPADPAALIAAVADSFAGIFQSRKIQLELGLDAAPKPVTLDSARVTEMLRNLILYSLDRIGPNPGLIGIHCRPSADRSTVEIRVSNSGPAFDAAAAKELFTPYEPDRDQLSTGLGLAIARRIAQTHNGSILLDPADKTFRVSLPLSMP
ncbi:MAG: GAF domain-containing sensor histidine kinase [Phycisphaerae bacterium]|nr:GAF domain-containing sensor histidine kinase [Phycisphaerae bacterium]